jgi:hypothetical protein
MIVAPMANDARENRAARTAVSATKTATTADREEADTRHQAEIEAS